MQVDGSRKCARCNVRDDYDFYHIHESGDMWCGKCWREMGKDEHPKNKPLFIEHIPGFAFPSDTRIFNFDSLEELEEKVKSMWRNAFDDGFELCQNDGHVMAHKDDKQFWWVLGYVFNFDISSLPKWVHKDGEGHICK